MIKIKNLEYIYFFKDKKIKALDNISLEVNKGDFISLIGTNASGKSTLAKHLNALLLPTSGDVIIDEMNTKDKENIPHIRKIVGMIFQNPDEQLIGSTVEEDIAFSLENLSLSSEEIKSRVGEILELMGLMDLKKKDPYYLSTGQKQLLAIASALSIKPEYLVLDEPTTMLEVKERKKILSLLKKLNQEKNITIIYITHFMEEAIEAKKIVVMEKGKIVLSGSKEEVFSQREMLQKSSLEIPAITELGYQLNIFSPVFTIEKMVEILCK